MKNNLPVHVNAYVRTQSHTFPHMALKPKVARVYLNQEAQDMLKAAAESAVDVSEAQIVSLVVLSGLRALKECQYRITLPLRLAVVGETEVPVVPSTRRL